MLLVRLLKNYDIFKKILDEDVFSSKFKLIQCIHLRAQESKKRSREMVSATSALKPGQADAWNIKEKHEKDIEIICTHTTYVPVEQNHNFIL